MLSHKLGIVMVATMAAAATVASADIVNTYSFTAITTNNTAAARATVGSQLQVTVQSPSTSSTYADFTFRNIIGLASNVTEVYFDGGSFLSGFAMTAATGTTFQTAPARTTNPGELPNSNAVNFLTSSIGDNKTSLDIGSGSNGLNALGDLLTVRINFTGKTVADLISSMASPTNDAWFRIGLHVRSIDGITSDSFVNAPPPVMVPLPAAVWPGLAMLGGAFGITAFRRRANKI